MDDLQKVRQGFFQPIYNFDASKNVSITSTRLFRGQDCFGYSMINVFRFCVFSLETNLLYFFDQFIIVPLQLILFFKINYNYQGVGHLFNHSPTLKCLRTLIAFQSNIGCRMMRSWRFASSVISEGLIFPLARI